jgi:hypothetical protein
MLVRKGPAAAVAFIMLSCFTSCGPEDNPTEVSAAAQECMATYSRENGYGFDEKSLEGVVVGGLPDARPDGSTVVIANPLEQLQSECAANGGSNCEPSDYQVTPQAAACLAEAYGLAAGISPWERSLIYNYGFKTVIWVIQNTTWSSQELHHKRGDALSISAATGKLLQRSQWEAIE